VCVYFHTSTDINKRQFTDQSLKESYHISYGYPKDQKLLAE
jgi:hypothetical protein